MAIIGYDLLQTTRVNWARLYSDQNAADITATSYSTLVLSEDFTDLSLLFYGTNLTHSAPQPGSPYYMTDNINFNRRSQTAGDYRFDTTNIVGGISIGSSVCVYPSCLVSADGVYFAGISLSRVTYSIQTAPSPGTLGKCTIVAGQYLTCQFTNKDAALLGGEEIKRTAQLDPYEPGGTSGPGGGDGTFDFSSTTIGWAGLPTISASDTGMIDIYVPSASQLQALSSYLWAGSFDPNNFLKLVANPMDVIIGMSIIPLTATEIGTSAATLAVGNISTGLSMPKATRQYVEIDCGSVSILPKWGAYLDFSPYSKLQLFLPYIGYVNISPDDCMNGSIAVKYSVDILAGVCVAQVMCYDAGTPTGHVLYELAGNCSIACPITAGQYQNIALAALRSVGSIAGMVTGTPTGIAAGIEDVANSVISCAKPDVQRSGGFGGSAGLMGHQIPYLILTIPKMCRPEHQNEFIGYPSFVEIQLSTISGYTEIESVHLQGIPGACDDDISEIEMLLKGGVIL